MQRYFIRSTQIHHNQISIVGEDVHHIRIVLRNQLGDQFICCDGEGTDFLVEILEIHAQTIICRILDSFDSEGEPKTEITIAQSLPKGDKIDWIIQKTTELGAVRFLPFFSERTVVKLDARKAEKRQVRWQKIVQEAAQQAHRGRIPVVEKPINWQELLKMISQYEQTWIAYEKGGVALRSVLLEKSVQQILLVIGPEGGFSEKEIAEAEAAGATSISLGSRILRTETASIAALTCILFAQKELGG